MHPFPKNRDYPYAVAKVLFTIIEKASTGGATLEDLQEAYEEIRGRIPSKKTVSRIIRRLNEMFDPLAYGETGEAGDEAGEASGEAGREWLDSFPRAIRTERRNGRTYYVFTRSLATPELDPGMALLMALSLYPQQRGLLGGEFEVVMKLVFEDILGKLASYYNVLKEIRRYVYVSGHASARPKKSFQTIHEILRAIRHRKRIKIEYLRAYDGELVTREVEPYGLLCRENNWYLVGRCSTRKERRVYLLDHIRRLEVMENSVYSIPPGFSLHEAYGQAWGVWTEEAGQPETVRLKVEKGLAEKFRVTRYHDSQQTKELPNGEIEVTFTVTGAQEMIPWLMTWGPTIEVLEPNWLREALAENLEETLKLYR